MSSVWGFINSNSKEVLGLCTVTKPSPMPAKVLSLLSSMEKWQKERVLSSVVDSSSKESQNWFSLFSSIVVICNTEKRRLTWCPGKMSNENWNEPYSTVQGKTSVVRPGRKVREVGPLLPFDDLVKELSVTDSCTEEEERAFSMEEDSILPNPVSLLHVTSRRKAPSRKKSLQMENNESAGSQLPYDDLLVKYETERAKSGMELDHLKKRLALASVCHDERHSDSFTDDNVGMDQSLNEMLTETEALCLIKQLQDKIAMLTMEKSLSQKKLDSVVELATEQTMAAKEKYEELYSAFQEAKEEVEIAHELNPWPLDGEGQCSDSFFKLAEIQELVSESRNLTEFAYSDMSDFCKYLISVPNLLAELRSSALQASDEIKTTISCYQKVNFSLESKVDKLENEKIILHNQSRDLHNQIEDLSSIVQNSANALKELSEEHELEKSEFLACIKVLEKEISSASSCSMAREKESLRKELEKVKTKLRDTEAKLKNSMQEKTKLEGEKACAEKENKLLRNQKTALERDISKQDTVFGKRRDSVAGNSSNTFDTKRGCSPAVAFNLEHYKCLEELAFEMETKIASLEEELMVAHREKEEAISEAENMSCELNALSEELNMTSVELTNLKEDTSTLKSCINDSERQHQDLQSSISKIMEEKEELAMQLTDALMLLEEENAIWSAKEKTSIESIEQKVKSNNSEVNSLLKEVSEVKKELDFYTSECKNLEDRWKHSVEKLEFEKKCSEEKSVEIQRLKEDLEVLDNRSKKAHDSLTSQLKTLSLEHQFTCEEMKKLQMELEKHGNSTLSNKLLVEKVKEEKEKAKVRMRVRSTQIKLDTIRHRYKEAVNEMDSMNRHYEAASVKLKDQAVSLGVEVMNLRKHLTSCTCTR